MLPLWKTNLFYYFSCSFLGLTVSQVWGLNLRPYWTVSVTNAPVSFLDLPLEDAVRTPALRGPRCCTHSVTGRQRLRHRGGRAVSAATGTDLSPTTTSRAQFSRTLTLQMQTDSSLFHLVLMGFGVTMGKFCSGKSRLIPPPSKVQGEPEVGAWAQRRMRPESTRLHPPNALQRLRAAHPAPGFSPFPLQRDSGRETGNLSVFLTDGLQHHWLLSGIRNILSV